MRQRIIHSQDAVMLEDPDLNISTYISAPVRQRPADCLINEGDEIETGSLKLKVIGISRACRGNHCREREKV